MSREVRRVPLEFDWPTGKVWRGYLRPDELEELPCEACNGRGWTPAHQWVTACAHMLLMLDDDLEAQQRGRPMHPYFNDFYTSGHGTRPSPDIREFGTGLAGRDGGFFGHDAVDGWRATEKIIRAAGLDPDTWGRCQACGAHGSTEKYPGQRAEAEAWQPTEPPTGDGWQLWETVSEGSPISPVFADADGLIDWLCSPAYAHGISQPMQRDQAERFVQAGWAPSMIASAKTGLVPGEQAVGLGVSG